MGSVKVQPMRLDLSNDVEDHEVELGLVIGEPAKDVKPPEGARAVFGCLTFEDASGREFPLEPSMVSRHRREDA